MKKQEATPAAPIVRILTPQEKRLARPRFPEGDTEAIWYGAFYKGKRVGMTDDLDTLLEGLRNEGFNIISVESV